ncbi:MAG: hypothetical protein KF678_10245 [Phycisphaeraceae bacterium]|nr:hypothetical protein [Phycisphaeraceae bacterium]
MTELATFGGATFVVLLLSALVFHAAARLGGVGKRLCEIAAAAPGLDVVVFYFTTAPWIGAVAVWATRGEQTFGRLMLLFVVAGASQVLTLLMWARLHEAMHPGTRKGPRIYPTLSRKVGPVRNHLAVWWTALVLPVFNLVRIAEIVLWPMLVWLVGFPRYPMKQWINVSRHKFSGLVGYDLIWCLYCDWMTGVWSLGTEMLRNVESFWCPIRFSSPEKCENCRIDFPDVENGWAPPTSDMAAVVKVLDEKYPGPGGVNAWFGHPVRLTVDRKPTEDRPKP